MAEKDFKRKLAALLSANVEGYPRHIDADVVAMFLSSTTVTFQ
jgi:hypothetical protein